MMGLSDGRKSFPIGLAVLLQYRSVTASQPHSHPASQPPSHVAVAITLYAKASSAKSTDCTSRFTVHIGYRHYARRPLSVSFSSINLLFTTHWTFMFIALRISITLMPICFYLDDFCTYLILIIVHKFFFSLKCVLLSSKS